MRILFVTPEPPFPITDGARLVVANLARELAKQHRLALLTFSVGEISDDLAVYFEIVRTVPRPTFSRWRKRAQTFIDPLPLLVRAHTSEEFSKSLCELLGANQFDVAHFDTPLVAGYLANSLPTVLAPHDTLTAHLQQMARYAPRRKQRLLARTQISRMRRFETMAYARATRVVFVTDREKNAFQTFAPQVDARVIPNGVDADFFAPRAVAQIPHSIAFLGVMGYAPNASAALYFVQNMLPQIWQQIPDATFSIIGREPTADVRALSADTRIRVTGTVDDVRPELAAHAIVVAPMRAAGGIKNKVLEAMAMGKPSVATPEAVEGLDARDGQEIAIARTADEFAQRCVRLLNDANERERFSHNARAWALKHSWKQTAAQYAALYQEAIGEFRVRE